MRGSQSWPPQSTERVEFADRRSPMPHDIVTIGTSAGGVEALQTIARQLPPAFPAAVFVVIHVHVRSRSYLPEILGRAGPLPAFHAEDGMPVEHGRIYIAPPDRHLIVERDHIHLSAGPKEQHQRR